MTLNKTAIHFMAYSEGKKYDLQTYAGEYRNLMVLLNDKIYLESFGECKGMCRCGTCIVEIEGLPSLVTMEANEERILDQAGTGLNNMRLSCQVLVDKNIENIIVRIISE